MIGARFSLYAMSDDFIDPILGSLGALEGTGLERDTDDVSTYVSGEENELFAALTTVFGVFIDRDEHVAIGLLLSRGCPGEPGADTCNPTITIDQQAKLLKVPGGQRQVACQFSLYPLGSHSYMDAIYTEIHAAAKAAGLKVTPQHFCTRLQGTLWQVMNQLCTAFDRAVEATPHVVIHATLAANSPSRPSDIDT